MSFDWKTDDDRTDNRDIWLIAAIYGAILACLAFVAGFKTLLLTVLALVGLLAIVVLLEKAFESADWTDSRRAHGV